MSVSETPSLMTVLHLPQSFLPTHVGGKEVYVLRFAQALQALGVKNVVAIHGDNAEENSYDFEGITVRVLPALTHRTPYTNRYSRTVDEVPRFGHLLDELTPELVHFHDQNDGASLTHLRAVKQRGLKAVITFHTPGQVCPERALLHEGKEICDGRLEPGRCTACQLQSFFKLPKTVAHTLAWFGRCKIEEPRGRAQKLVAHRHMTGLFIESYRQFAQLADKTIVFTEWARKTFQLNGVGEEKLAVIDTGGNPSMDWGKEKTYDGNGQVFEICYIGRCEWIKGIHLLIEAVKLLDPSVPVKVFFYSHSWENHAYGRSLLQKIAGDSRFEPPRLVENSLLAQTISRHHVCVIPSIWPETGPLTVFDAFGAGLPVIGADSAGIADHVRAGTDGLLFHNGEARELKKVIEQLATDPSLYQKLRGNIRKNRTIGDVAQETQALYQQLLKPEKARCDA